MVAVLIKKFGKFEKIKWNNNKKNRKKSSRTPEIEKQIY